MTTVIVGGRGEKSSRKKAVEWSSGQAAKWRRDEQPNREQPDRESSGRAPSGQAAQWSGEDSQTA